MLSEQTHTLTRAAFGLETIRISFELRCKYLEPLITSTILLRLAHRTMATEITSPRNWNANIHPSRKYGSCAEAGASFCFVRVQMNSMMLSLLTFSYVPLWYTLSRGSRTRGRPPPLPSPTPSLCHTPYSFVYVFSSRFRSQPSHNHDVTKRTLMPLSFLCMPPASTLGSMCMHSTVPFRFVLFGSVLLCIFGPLCRAQVATQQTHLWYRSKSDGCALSWNQHRFQCSMLISLVFYVSAYGASYPRNTRIQIWLVGKLHGTTSERKNICNFELFEQICSSHLLN